MFRSGLYAERKAAGKCTRCGCRPPRAGGTICRTCAARRNRKRRTEYAAREEVRQAAHEQAASRWAGLSEADRQKERLRLKNRYRQLRAEALRKYGELCACCGESRYEFLVIDHVLGGGTAHRKRLRKRTIYAWLKENGYPPGFRVLCVNCNHSLGLYGYCPHSVEAAKAS